MKPDLFVLLWTSVLIALQILEWPQAILDKSVNFSLEFGLFILVLIWSNLHVFGQFRSFQDLF